MKVYAVIDTNVIVSALLSNKSDAATVRVLKMVEQGEICPLIHEEIIKEYEEVLGRAKFHLPYHLVQNVIQKIKESGQEAERIRTMEIISDPKDIVFYEVALSKDDAYLVTGNKKHFPQKPIVVTPAEMMDILAEIENR
ncbi:MAG: putative toxin-antitoxin system toxin component, PIN family [Salinivirgaceae bacterium]|nr:putative toxin-antitoxin system toxin component, PIN family [Salinivirgaceae bacterium]